MITIGTQVLVAHGVGIRYEAELMEVQRVLASSRPAVYGQNEEGAK